MKKLFQYLSIILLLTGGVILIPLQYILIGYIILTCGLLTLLFCTKQFRKDIFLLYLSIIILGFTPITTNIGYWHFIQMGIDVFLALALPYSISRFVYKDYLVRFRFHHGRYWYKSEILYILVTAVIAYFLVPFYLKNTGVYHNWTVILTPSFLIRLFIGTNSLGIWDELFFISTVLGILRRHLSFNMANLAQAVLFTSFLYELGFRGWGYIMMYFFALIQGYVFKKTDSLFYVITIHLTLDLILYLALINAYFPSSMPIFCP